MTDTDRLTDEPHERPNNDPTSGPAAVIRTAWQTAPPEADRELVQAVAYRAYRDDVDPEELWDDVRPVLATADDVEAKRLLADQDGGFHAR